MVILGGGEASGPLYPPEEIDESMFSCEAREGEVFAVFGRENSPVDGGN